MKIHQYHGPFTTNEIIEFSSFEGMENYVKLGIQTVFSGTVINENNLNPDLYITIDNISEGYYINYDGILEFNDFVTKTISIKFNRDFPAATTIEAGYE